MEKVCFSENLAHDILKIFETCSVTSNIIYHREKLLKVIGNIWNQIWLNLNMINYDENKLGWRLERPF